MCGLLSEDRFRKLVFVLEITCASRAGKYPWTRQPQTPPPSSALASCDRYTWLHPSKRRHTSSRDSSPYVYYDDWRACVKKVNDTRFSFLQLHVSAFVVVDRSSCAATLRRMKDCKWLMDKGHHYVSYIFGHWTVLCFVLTFFTALWNYENNVYSLISQRGIIK